jgi:hypothetical protein
LSPPLAGQTVRGSITVEVLDQSKSVIPGAKLTLTHLDTGRVFSAEADQRGECTFSLLAPGKYRLEAEHPGFKKIKQEFELSVNQQLRLKTVLPLGQLEQIITHGEETATQYINEETPALGTIIENRKVRNLPLDGRNFFELSLLVPGALPAAQGTAGSARGDFALSVSGAREDANLFLLDGAYNGDPKLNGIGVTPPVDGIREFEVLTNNYDASFGRNAGGQVNAALKSGSNSWHGTAYEFFRIAALDARNHFAPSNEPDPKYQRNQFGFSLGGPMRREKTFVFADYEGTIRREGITRITNVPTLAERSGDFTSSSLPVPNVPGIGLLPVIPSMFQHPVGAAIANLFPEPNRSTPGANYVASPTERDNQHQFDVRIDQMISAGAELSARYSFVDRDLFEPFAGSSFSPLPGYGNNVPRRAQNFALSYTHAFSPNWINEARFAWNRVAIQVNQEGQGTSTNQQVGLPELSSNARDFGLSFIRVTSFGALGQEYNNPQASASDTFQIGDQANYASGRNSVKFGFDYRRIRQNAFRDVQSRGILNFQGVFTGNPLADLLLGLPTVTGGATLDNPQRLRNHSLNFFVQNNYRVANNVTLSAGLRYEFTAPAVDADDRANVYDPATGQLVQVGTNGVPRAGYHADKNNFGPRVGIAWGIGRQQNTVVRAGYGMYFDQSALAPSEGLYFSPPYFNFNFYFSLTPQPPFFPGYTLTLSDPFPSNFPVPTPPSAFTFQRDLRTPYVQQWNVSVQQRLGNKRVLEFAYAGSKGTKLTAARDINQPVPSTVFPNLRPNPQFDDITAMESRGSSTYHALQVRFQQSYDFGLSVLSSYTWSKSIDDVSGFFPASGDANFPQDSNTLTGERSLSNFDARQRLSISYGYDFPYCRDVGGRITYTGWQSWIFGGWATYGIITFQSGRPFSVALLPEVDNSNTGRSVLGFQANDRPNLVGNPVASNPTESQWFNTSAFAMPAFGSFGNAGRNILEGPGLAVFNISLVKNIGITEGTRLQFRVESFNLFNRTNYNLPDNFFGSPTFGQILSAQNPRHMQFGLKFLF